MTAIGPVLLVMALRVEMAQLPEFVKRDADGAEEPRVVAERCGIGLENAACVAEAAIGHWQPRAVLVAGIVAGLQPDLRPGHSVVLDAVRGPDSEVRATRGLADTMEAALRTAGISCGRGDGWSVNGIADVADKRRLGSNGALTVDSESHAVLSSAAAHGIPSAALRVVADPSTRGVPRSIGALGWVDGAQWWPDALDIWRLPLELGDVAWFRRDLRHALDGLRRALPPVLTALAVT